MTARSQPAGPPAVTPDLFRGPLSGEAPDLEIESAAPEPFVLSEVEAPHVPGALRGSDS
jgi:hypothetical protein